MQSASGSAAPIGDMMIIVGDSLFGVGRGRIFMLVEAFTVFLALIGTTLSCMNTGARVTYAMGKDREVPEHFGLLHGDNLSPHRAIWTLAVISAVIGCIAVIMPFGNAGAPAKSRPMDQPPSNPPVMRSKPASAGSITTEIRRRNPGPAAGSSSEAGHRYRKPAFTFPAHALDSDSLERWPSG